MEFNDEPRIPPCARTAYTLVRHRIIRNDVPLRLKIPQAILLRADRLIE